MIRGHLFLLLPALLAAMAATLSAQDANGRISGTVTDNTGGVVPEGANHVTNQNSQLKWKAAR